MTEETSEVSVTPLFKVVATTRLDVTAGKLTEHCFAPLRYLYRVADIDNKLPTYQQHAEAAEISTLAPVRDWRFADAAENVLGIGSVPDVDTNYTKALGQLLIRRGYLLTLPQAEAMTEDIERRTKLSGSGGDGLMSFFFTLTADPENPVAVGEVSRSQREWGAFLFDLDSRNRWGADGAYFLVPNFKQQETE
jgi:hypothetical protein